VRTAAPERKTARHLGAVADERTETRVSSWIRFGKYDCPVWFTDSGRLPRGRPCAVRKEQGAALFAIVGPRPTHLHNFPLVFNCLIEIASFGVSGGECIDVTPILPLR
jgi:hypothetical protein